MLILISAVFGSSSSSENLCTPSGAAIFERTLLGFIFSSSSWPDRFSRFDLLFFLQAQVVHGYKNVPAELLYSYRQHIQVGVHGTCELTHFDPPTCSVFRLLILSKGLCQEATSFLSHAKTPFSDAACGNVAAFTSAALAQHRIPLPTACTALMH